MRRVDRICGVSLAAMLAAGCVAAADWGSDRSSEYCQILDARYEPVYEVRFGYVGKADVKGSEETYGRTGVMEIDADWNFAYFYDIGQGDIDLSLMLESFLLLDSANVQLPDQLVRIALDGTWTWRYVNGMAAQIGILPGIYSDLEATGSDSFAVPVRAALIRAFNPYFAGIAGVEYRADFDQPVMPLVGVEWEIADALRLEARIPESRLIWFLNQDWNTYAGFDWQNTTFALREKGNFDRKKLTLEDYRLYWGLAHRFSDTLQLRFEIGQAFDRSLDFARGVVSPDGEVLIERDLDVEDAVFVRFGVGGPF